MAVQQCERPCAKAASAAQPYAAVDELSPHCLGPQSLPLTRSRARKQGYEINPTLVGYSHLRSALSPNERYRLKSLWEAELHDADVVFVFGVPSILAELQKKLSAELRPGAHVVSNTFPFSTAADTAWVEVDRRYVDTGGMARGELDDSGRVFLYRVGDEQEPSEGRRDASDAAS